LFHTGGAHGIHPSELSPHGRLPPHFRGSRTHMPFLPSVIPPPKRWAGPTGRGFWALTLPRVPGRRHSVNASQAGCSLGFRLPRVYQSRPGPGFRPNSSHALPRTTTSRRPPAGASEYRSALAWLLPSSRKPDAWREQPFQGSCTKTNLSVQEGKSPGL